ncbi:MAG: Fic family protein [Gammaproteobacteria bacterium]|nr:Fic family protein [Gammaproteobacteria bacterium]
MTMEEFIAGELKQQFEYKSFQPNFVNLQWSWDSPEINTRLEKSSRALAELNAFSLIVPDIDLFIRMHVQKEASQSSKIEGTQTHIDDVILDVSQVDPEKRDDWQEVQNYVQAMSDAINDLETLPLSVRLLKKTHEILMQGVRGEHKAPGDFRISQNWIGGTNLNNAVFVPPHFEDVPELMSDLEKLWHNESINVPELIRIAISHYQFETIHPFLDGNGRIGRLLITLYLISRGILNKPSLYLSDYLEKNRIAYYDALTRVRVSNDLVHWIIFFLDAVIETAESSKKTFQKIMSMRNELEAQMVTLGRRAENARKLLLHLYTSPAVTGGDVARLLDVTPRAANGLINEFVKLEILKEITGYQRNRLFIFRKYIQLFG